MYNQKLTTSNSSHASIQNNESIEKSLKIKAYSLKLKGDINEMIFNHDLYQLQAYPTNKKNPVLSYNVGTTTNFYNRYKGIQQNRNKKTNTSHLQGMMIFRSSSKGQIQTNLNYSDSTCNKLKSSQDCHTPLTLNCQAQFYMSYKNSNKMIIEVGQNRSSQLPQINCLDRSFAGIDEPFVKSSVDNLIESSPPRLDNLSIYRRNTPKLPRKLNQEVDKATDAMQNYKYNKRYSFINRELQVNRKSSVNLEPTRHKFQLTDLKKIIQNCPKNVVESNDIQFKLLVPDITAKSWLIYDKLNESVIDGRKMNKRMEVASLTKIMTFYVCNEILKRYNLVPENVQIRVSKQASDTIGTSGQLQYGDLLTINDLYHAMMLPSGNDAALAIAQGIGTIILHEEKQHHKRLHNIKILDVELLSAEGDYYNPDEFFHYNPIDFFLREMNNQANKLDLKNSNFDSPHGMSNRENVTCASDLAKLCSHCSDIGVFQQVVQCKEYQTTALQRDSKPRAYTWRNTNKLLDKGFIGIKTGITESAGPCLASAYRINNLDGSVKQHFIVIVIKSDSMDKRWDETLKLVDYALKKLAL